MEEQKSEGKSQRGEEDNEEIDDEDAEEKYETGSVDTLPPRRETSETSQNERDRRRLQEVDRKKHVTKIKSFDAIKKY